MTLAVVTRVNCRRVQCELYCAIVVFLKSTVEPIICRHGTAITSSVPVDESALGLMNGVVGVRL